jgi:hypothetical protein
MSNNCLLFCLPLLVFLPCRTASAQTQGLGALAYPATLKSGQLAVSGFVGAPFVGTGFRQGIGGVELSGHFEVDTLRLGGALEGLVKVPVFQKNQWQGALGLGLGAAAQSGARSFDASNIAFFGARTRIQAVVTHPIAETAGAVLQLDVPVTFSMPDARVWQVSSLLGGGVEMYLGNSASGLLMGQVGATTQHLDGLPSTTFAWQVKLGVGWRLF